MSRTVSVTLDDETADVLAALACVERWRRSPHASAVKAIIGERCAHLLKADPHIREHVERIRVARVENGGQQRFRGVTT